MSGNGEALKVDDLRQPWTVLLSNGEAVIARWTEQEAEGFIANPTRSIVARDEGGRVVRVVFAAAIAMVLRGQPSNIAVPAAPVRIARS